MGKCQSERPGQFECLPDHKPKGSLYPKTPAALKAQYMEDDWNHWAVAYVSIVCSIRRNCHLSHVAVITCPTLNVRFCPRRVGFWGLLSNRSERVSKTVAINVVLTSSILYNATDRSKPTCFIHQSNCFVTWRSTGVVLGTICLGVHCQAPASAMWLVFTLGKTSEVLVGISSSCNFSCSPTCHMGGEVSTEAGFGSFQTSHLRQSRKLQCSTSSKSEQQLSYELPKLPALLLLSSILLKRAAFTSSVSVANLADSYLHLQRRINSEENQRVSSWHLITW
jgi:hypothetical protein